MDLPGLGHPDYLPLGPHLLPGDQAPVASLDLGGRLLQRLRWTEAPLTHILSVGVLLSDAQLAALLDVCRNGK